MDPHDRLNQLGDDGASFAQVDRLAESHRISVNAHDMQCLARMKARLRIEPGGNVSKMVLMTEDELRDLVTRAVGEALASAKARDGDRPMTVEDVAEELRVCTKTVLTLIRKEGLPARKVGKSYRVFSEDLHTWLSARK